MNRGVPQVPRIGVLLGEIVDRYQQTILKGLLSFGAGKSKVFIVYGGPLQDTNRRNRPRNLLYDQFGSHNLEAIITFTGTLLNNVGKERVLTQLEKYGDIPIVSIGIGLEGIPSLIVDNQIGTYSLVSHFIEKHDRRRIVFVKGAEFNDESEARFQGYRQALEDHGLPFDPLLALPGNFEKESGRKAVLHLLRQKIEFDAIVGVDDYTIIGAREVLESKGVAVPDQVILGGFDDIDLCLTTVPTLTTVRQPLFEMGELAMKSVLSLLDGRPVPGEICLPVNLVVRESCGCSEQLVSTIGAQTPAEGEDLATSVKNEIKRDLNVGNFQDAEQTFIGSKVMFVVDCLLEACRTRNSSLLDKRLEDIFFRGLEGGFTRSLWIEILNRTLTAFLWENLKDHEAGLFADHMRTRFFLALYRVETLFHARHRLLREDSTDSLSQTGDELLNSFNVEDIKAILADAFVANGIRCQISLFGETPDVSRVFVHVTDHRQRDLEDCEFETSQLVPPGSTLLEMGPFLITALQRDFEPFGRALFEVGQAEYKDCEHLANRAAAAIIGSQLMQSVREQADLLEIEVAERTKELFRVNQKLLEKSYTDDLSGLKNRRFFGDVVFPEAMHLINNLKYHKEKKNQRGSTPSRNVIGILMADIDHFKHVNDSYGHDSGDLVIKQLSDVLRSCVRASDHVIRYGGEEFVIVLKDIDPEYLPLVAENIRRKVKNHSFEILGNTVINKTCSLGCVTFPPSQEHPDAIGFSNTVTLADMALLFAKEHGRDRSVLIKLRDSFFQDIEADNLGFESLSEAMDKGWAELTVGTDPA